MRTVNVKGESTVNSGKCTMERTSPWPRTVTLTEFSQYFAVVGDPSYALGVLRWSSVGLTEVMAGAGGGGGWNGREGKRFPV